MNINLTVEHKILKDIATWFEHENKVQKIQNLKDIVVLMELLHGLNIETR